MRAVALLGVVATMGVAGCSLLVSFDDIPDGGASSGEATFDGGLTGSSSSGSSGTGTSSSSSSSSSSSGTIPKTDSGTTPAYPPACDTTANLNAIDCSDFSGSVCGADLAATAGIANTDLIECDGAGKATCVRRCTMGCVDPPGKDAQCANCPNKTDPGIWFCGKDVGFTAADDADTAFECSNGKLVPNEVANCGTGLCHTKCTRTSPPPLNGACCQAN